MTHVEELGEGHGRGRREEEIWTSRRPNGRGQSDDVQLFLSPSHAKWRRRDTESVQPKHETGRRVHLRVERQTGEGRKGECRGAKQTRTLR